MSSESRKFLHGRPDKNDSILETLYKVKRYNKNKEKHKRSRVRVKSEEGLQKEDKEGDASTGVPLSNEKLRKYRKLHTVKKVSARTKIHAHMFQQKRDNMAFAVSQAARSEFLLQEQTGFLEADEGETTAHVKQDEIVDCVDILTTHKVFELFLKDFGPYRLNYTRNGRQLLLGGQKGHIAALDWQTKKLMCEFNVMETINDVKWLHQETMYAVAQRLWTYIYDNQGIELHCLKTLDQALRLEFLPFHFLLAASTAKGYLSYIDTSIGKKVAGMHVGTGRLDVMCQNPQNAVLHLGHPTGVVTLWTPNQKQYCAKMLCHLGGVRAVAVDTSGKHMATSGLDGKMKLWDLRTYKMMQSYKLPVGAGSLAFSQSGLVAAGTGNVVQVFKDCCHQTITSPYMQHRVSPSIKSLQFCPYEDILGVSHTEGFESIIIPGSGEANFDALEVNPYQTKKQRQQTEVKMLLDKIQPEMITLDADKISQLRSKTYDEVMKDKFKFEFLKVDKKHIVPKYKMRGASKSGNIEIRKHAGMDVQRRHVAKKAGQLKRKKNANTGKKSVLDRFKRRDK